MSAAPRVIRTPDQRLRVFVSSTLKELAPERRAARTAIERLHLAPVMFELGARPHPPRELYRAYLDQSDVFVGLYWERYGWVAPDEQVSGLEDEYDLCPPELPRLMYIKDPAPNREPRLKELLDRVRSDDRASFKYFESADELKVLLEADLATLLAERFELSRSPIGSGVEEPTPTAAPVTALPSPLTRLIGREADLAAVRRLFSEGARIVTITGPGGMGKSRLAIAAAAGMGDAFPDGAVFVDLSLVHDPAGVTGALAHALGVRDTGDAPLGDKVTLALRDRRLLLVLDNFEQVLSAAPAVTALLAAAPAVSVMVTSRALLRVSGERSFELGPLPFDSATALFVERAHAVKPDFEITAANADDVERICSAVDRVPLAIELAAARIRVLAPHELARRLDRRLPLLVGGARDLPARQRTLRATIEWSTQLLDEPERRLLAQLGVFEGGFTLEAAEAITHAASDTLSGLAALVDSSLVSQHENTARPRFSMLAVVREYALEQLETQGELGTVRDAHAAYFVALAEQADPELEGGGQHDWVMRLGEDTGNLRATVRHLLDERDWTRAAHLAWSLYVYWWVAGLLGEVRVWMDEVLGSGADLDERTRAIALYFTQAITFWQDPEGTVTSSLTESAELFHRAGESDGEALALISFALAVLASPEPDAAQADDAMETSLDLFRTCGDRWGQAMALVMQGRVALLRQHVDVALARFEESLALARDNGDELGVTIAQHHRGWARLLLGDATGATADFSACLSLSSRLGHVEGIAYALEGLVAVAALSGHVERAGRLLGAARSLRERTGLHNAPAFSFHQLFVDRMLGAGADRATFDDAVGAGRGLSAEQAVGEAERTETEELPA
jgi:predicted ATPase